MPIRKSDIVLQGLLLDLYRRGLGELMVMHRTEKEVLVGNIVMDKGKLTLKDLGLMRGVSPASVAACWDLGIVGAICNLANEEWESLSFLGVDHCEFEVDLSTTRRGVLMSAVGQYGDKILDFKGSFYRGSKLALEAHLLPVVLLHPIKTSLGVPGLAVADLKMASIPLDTIVRLNDLVNMSVEKKLAMDVMDLDIPDGEFEKLFGSYLK